MRLLPKIARKMRLLAHDALFAAGLRQAGAILSKPGSRILAYHGLDSRGDKTLNGRFISASEFESQIRFLSQYARIVSLDDYYAQNLDAQAFNIVITFDDGYANNLHYALPVLEKYAAPATFFLTAAAARNEAWLWMDFLDVATRLAPATIEIDGRVFQKKRWRHRQYFVDAAGRTLADWARYSPWAFVKKMEAAFQHAGAWDGAEDWSEYWRLLTPPEIRQLAASPYASVGAHGHTHQDLAFLPHEAACAELRQCKAALEHLCGKPLHALAYPFGAYTRALLDYAADLGFRQQLAVDFLFAEDLADPRLRERLTINPYISANNQWLAVQNGRY